MHYSTKNTIFADTYLIMKRIFVIALLFFAVRLQAQVRIGQVEAQATAERFLLQNSKEENLTLSLNEVIKSERSGQSNLFVFSVAPKGFVIVSALNEVLAYSLTSAMPRSEDFPDHIAYWLDLYNQQTDYLVEHSDKARKPMPSQHSVDPMLTSCWGQGCYHNTACPMDNDGPCLHVSAGCVAIAMAQVMYYHKRPEKGYGYASYSCPPYGTLWADFGQTIYRWDEMADTLHSNNSSVAKLVYHCGVSVKTQYSAHASSSSSTAALKALQDNFYYPTSILSNRSDINDETWCGIVKSEIDSGRPIVYFGTSSLGGHAFVCDGYDDNGLFHFNFGWDGVADGYYTIDDPSGFSESQSIIHNIYPINDINIHSDDHGIIYVSPDGTGDGSSWAEATSELQQAIFKSYSDTITIWVKEGSYVGDTAYDYAFRIPYNTRLYGGFKGDEPFGYNLALRDLEMHPSILDGRHKQGVVNITGDISVIDGFTIQNGKSSRGAGLLLTGCSQIKNCKICRNYAKTDGGGLSRSYILYSGQITVEDCEFFENEAKNNGGAINDYGDITLLRCKIHDNIARTKGGGIFSNAQKKSQFINCTISNNTAKQGGGFFTGGEEVFFWSCLINNNTAETGGGCSLGNLNRLYNCTIVKNEALVDYGGVDNSVFYTNILKNCIIWGNTSQGQYTQIGPAIHYSYCAVQDDQSQNDFNFNAETENDGGLPSFYLRFNDAEVEAGNTGYGGDWRLQSNSLCINRGTNMYAQPETDLDGNPRSLHGHIDLGAYETNTATHDIIAYICENDPYYYQDSLLSESGLYTFLYPGAPCDSLVIVTIEIPPTSVFLNEEICENETYDFFGTILNEPGEYTTTKNCITYELDLNVKPMEHKSINEEICEGETYDFFGNLINDAGHYSYIDNCKTYELDLSVSPWTNSFVEAVICEGETYDFCGTTLRYGGHYSRTIGCNTYDLDLTVNPSPTLQCSNDTIVEYGHLVQLTASGADYYLWSTGDTTASITIYPVTDRNYTVKGFYQNGCNASASVMVRVYNESDEEVLYPNPASDKVEIYNPLLDEVVVFNLLGVQIDRISTNRQAVSLDVSQYERGVYIVLMRCMKKYYYKKLIVKD